MLRRTILTLILTTGLCGTVGAQYGRYGVRGKAAPAWEVEKWINLPEGQGSLNVSDFKGKVLYLYCFQSWCPGCHSHGFPTLRKLVRHYRDDADVAFVAVQTTFEGFAANTAKKAWGCARKYNLSIPVGHTGTNGVRSALMRAYRTGGTPWTIVIGTEGKVQYNDFRIHVDVAVKLIDRLKGQAKAAAAVED